MAMSALTTAARGHTGHDELATRLAAACTTVASALPTAVVVATAAVSSWAGWVLLGEATRLGTIGGLDLAWILPVSVDTFAFMAARTWRIGHTATTRRWGLGTALAALALSIAGNAGGHAAQADVWTPGWVAVVAVAMIPPAVLFAVLLLATMASRDRHAEQAKAAEREARRGQRTAPTLPPVQPTQVATVAPSNADTRARVQRAYDRDLAADVATTPYVDYCDRLATELGDVKGRTVRRHLDAIRRERRSEVDI